MTLSAATRSANGWLDRCDGKSYASGAVMNAILIFPTALAAELKQLRSEVASHRELIDASVVAWEQTRAVIASRESDLSRRLNALRQRLALLA